MRKLTINNFGPIDGTFELDLDKKLTVLIGEQATGKTTFSRILYYCLLCDTIARFYTSKQRISFLELKKNEMEEYFRRHYKTGNFSFVYDEYNLFFDIAKKINENTVSKNDLPMVFDKFYIPAGRSTIPLIFDSYAAAKNIEVNPFLDMILLYLDKTRKDHQITMQEILKQIIKFSDNEINEDNAKACIQLIKEILKGEYSYSPGNEQIFYNKTMSVPITLASSGQQEILYILLILFEVLLEAKPHTIIIEEPEANMFPIAQKLIMELIARVINATGSNVIITTHSPYIISSTNLLLYSDKVENNIDSKNPIVDPMARLAIDDVSAFLLERNEKFSYRSIIDNESNIIRGEEIDTVSEIINEKLADLVSLEVENDL